MTFQQLYQAIEARLGPKEFFALGVEVMHHRSGHIDIEWNLYFNGQYYSTPRPEGILAKLMGAGIEDVAAIGEINGNNQAQLLSEM